ncbi:MAG: hypothetical protein K6E92_01725 [Lachnospiraceae bacterium]|nr:hypothetical protein [Lachnospiraceae bacterium]
MDIDRISELLKAAAQEPAAPKRLVERTCWKARVAEERLAQEATSKKAGVGAQPDLSAKKQPPERKM